LALAKLPGLFCFVWLKPVKNLFSYPLAEASGN